MTILHCSKITLILCESAIFYNTSFFWLNSFAKKMKHLSLYYFSILIFLSIDGMAQKQLNRKDLLAETLTLQTVSKVDVKEIILEPSQTAPLHKHPCPVFGYVAEGSLLFAVQGQKPKLLNQGDAFYEPADTPITHFDNASTNKPVKFIAFYLTNNDKPLIEILPPNSKK